MTRGNTSIGNPWKKTLTAANKNADPGRIAAKKTAAKATGASLISRSQKTGAAGAIGAGPNAAAAPSVVAEPTAAPTS